MFSVNQPRRPLRRAANARLSVDRWRITPRFVSVVATALCVMLLGTQPTADAAAKKTTAKTKKSSSKKPAPKLVTLSENQARKAKVRKQRIAASSQVSALKDEDKRVEQTLEALNDDLKDQNAALGNEKRALAEAEQDVADARTAVSETSAAIKALSGQRQVAAVQAYIEPQSNRLAMAMNSESLSSASTGRVYLDLVNREQAANLDKLEALQEDRAAALSKAEKAEKRRAEKRRAAAKRLRSLTAAQARTEKYSDLVEERFERALSEAESLAAIDKVLSRQISKQQEAFARQLAASRRNGVRGKDGKVIAIKDFPKGSTNGIQVAASIRGKLAAMLAAAAADGIYFTGGGYRSAAGQIAVRRRNCGSSTYAVYQMRSSQCRPPTARPGSSQHERGLAIDFVQNGRGLHRGSSGYAWLRRNAAKYGFYNLPSEPWHWSTTGR